MALAASAIISSVTGILGNFPLDQESSHGLVDGWKQQPGMLGLRFTFQQPHMQTWLTDGTMDWLWPAARQAGLPVALAASAIIPSVTGLLVEREITLSTR